MIGFFIRRRYTRSMRWTLMAFASLDRAMNSPPKPSTRTLKTHLKFLSYFPKSLPHMMWGETVMLLSQPPKTAPNLLSSHWEGKETHHKQPVTTDPAIAKGRAIVHSLFVNNNAVFILFDIKTGGIAADDWHLQQRGHGRWVWC